MARSKPREVPTLASRWSPPDGAGQPLACVATTYTFHAPLFEADLLPRFLGLKFDATEGERPFFVERSRRWASPAQLSSSIRGTSILPRRRSAGTNSPSASPAACSTPS